MAPCPLAFNESEHAAGYRARYSQFTLTRDCSKLAENHKDPADAAVLGGAMGVADDTNLRLNAQRALLTHVTPRLRAVSVDIAPESCRVWARFIFDGEPSESVRDAAACAGTEIIADYPEGWDIAEEFVACPAPAKMDHLRLLVYHRCEDEWVHE